MKPDTLLEGVIILMNEIIVMSDASIVWELGLQQNEWIKINKTKTAISRTILREK